MSFRVWAMCEFVCVFSFFFCSSSREAFFARRYFGLIQFGRPRWETNSKYTQWEWKKRTTENRKQIEYGTREKYTQLLLKNVVKASNGLASSCEWVNERAHTRSSLVPNRNEKKANSEWPKYVCFKYTRKIIESLRAFSLFCGCMRWIHETRHQPPAECNLFTQLGAIFLLLWLLLLSSSFRILLPVAFDGLRGMNCLVRWICEK